MTLLPTSDSHATQPNLSESKPNQLSQDMPAPAPEDLVSKQQEWIQEELEKRRQNGEDTGVMAQFGAMKTVMGRLQSEMKKDSGRGRHRPVRTGLRVSLCVCVCVCGVSLRIAQRMCTSQWPMCFLLDSVLG